MKNSSYLISFFVAVLLLVTGCKQKMEKKEKYSYATAINGPSKYPVEVYRGVLYGENDALIGGFPRCGAEGGGWNFDGTTCGAGGSGLPYKLDLTYIAYAEKKFYRVVGKLPTEKIKALFDKGHFYKDRRQGEVHTKYNTFSVGLAPGGIAVVWLSGMRNRMEICRLQAKETFVDVNDFYDNSHERTQQEFYDIFYDLELKDEAKKEIAEKGIDYRIFDRYRERFTYRFTLDSYLEDDAYTYMSNKYYNGEREELLKDFENYYERSVPYIHYCLFKDYSTEIEFNDIETLTVMSKLKRKYPEASMDIVIRPTFNYDTMEVFVRCKSEQIALKKFKLLGVWGGPEFRKDKNTK